MKVKAETGGMYYKVRDAGAATGSGKRQGTGFSLKLPKRKAVLPDLGLNRLQKLSRTYSYCFKPSDLW